MLRSAPVDGFTLAYERSDTFALIVPDLRGFGHFSPLEAPNAWRDELRASSSTA